MLLRIVLVSIICYVAYFVYFCCLEVILKKVVEIPLSEKPIQIGLILLGSGIMILGFLHARQIVSLITIIAIVVSTFLICLFIMCAKPITELLKLKRLRATLEDERKAILRKDPLKYKRFKTLKLEELLAEYQALRPEEYARYNKYSKNKNYPLPLVTGEEIIAKRMNVISHELHVRRWN